MRNTRSIRHGLALSIAVAAALAVVGCDSTAQYTGAVHGDWEIAAVTTALSRVDLGQGQLALQRTRNAEVRSFAARVVSEVTAAMQAQAELQARTGIEAAQSSLSRDIEDDGAEGMAALKEQYGADFDRAYIQSQVETHERALRLLDEQLLEAAQNAELRAMLVTMRSAAADRLSVARQVEAVVRSDGDGG